MFLIYILSGIVVLNIITIFLIKNKFLTQFISNTSLLILFLIIPKALVEYGVMDKNVIDELYGKMLPK